MLALGTIAAGCCWAENALARVCGCLDNSHRSCLREATSQLELMMIESLGERLPARHDDEALPVRERDRPPEPTPAWVTNAPR